MHIRYILLIMMIMMICIMYYILRVYYFFVYMRNIIFPYQINDIKLNENITTEPNYNRIKQAAFKEPSIREIIFLLKYKKFMDANNIYSMCQKREVDQITKLLINVIKNNINGALIETGVWRGGMGMWMKCILKYYRDQRKIYLFDTFTYFP